jgi:hypothetical protein
MLKILRRMFRAAVTIKNFSDVTNKYYSERMEELLKKEQELLRMNAEIDEKNRKLRKDDRKKTHDISFVGFRIQQLQNSVFNHNKSFLF